MTEETFVKPAWMKVEAGEPLTPLEAFRYYISGPLSQFTWRVKITPAMRERCVDYALRSGGNGSTAPWALTQAADEIAEYIAKGKRP